MTDRIWLSNHSAGERIWDSKFRLFYGRPRATEEHTVEQLEAMDLVGVYRASDDPAVLTEKDNL